MTTPTVHAPPVTGNLGTLLTLYRLRSQLIDHGWTQAELWADQDTPYPGHGPSCLVGGVCIVIGRPDLTVSDAYEAIIDHHPVVVSLVATLALEHPHGGMPVRWVGNADREARWDKLIPADKLATWNDASGRTVREVVALIDATIVRLESA